MVRKTVPSGKKKYIYYVCSAHKNDRTACYSHNLRDTTIRDIVLDSLKKHIQDVIDLAELLKMTDAARLQQAAARKLQGRLEKKQEEASRYQALLQSLYENLADGLLDKNEYLDYKKMYSRRREEAEKQTEAIREEIEREIAGSTESRGWMERFRSCRNITDLDRTIVVSLIERILVYRDYRVEIVYRWHNEFQWYTELLQAQKSVPEKEAI